MGNTQTASWNTKPKVQTKQREYIAMPNNNRTSLIKTAGTGRSQN